MSASPVHASPLEHSLSRHFPEIRRFRSTSEWERSELYRKLKPEIDGVLNAVYSEAFAKHSSESSRTVTALAWNIERGIQLQPIIDTLRSHATLRSADLLLLTELDYGMARSGNHFVARELAEACGMWVAFAPCYVALTKGSGAEAEMSGENTFALHGNALLSRYPLRAIHSFALPNGKDKMAGKEKRLGSQRAVIADVLHPAGDFRAVTLHLDAHSSQRHRHHQMHLLLDHLERLTPKLPTLIGGDWNTTTHDASRALYSILGYWRRVMMGVKHVVRNHYPYPERWFERHLFQELESRGFQFRNLNIPGACTLHYDVSSLATFKNLAEWVPLWCFKFIEWALKDLNGRCSLKLDWFAGRGIEPDPGEEGTPLRVFPEVNHPVVLSDHDPIWLRFSVADRVRP